MRLKGIVNKIQDETLRQRVLEFLNDLTVEVEGKTYVGKTLEEAPASRFRHHSYPGGLIEHIVSAVKIAIALCDSVEKIYRGKVNRDLVIGGVLLHDILKPLTYDIKEDGSYVSSPLGERLDHLTLIVSEMIKRGFPLDLIHIVAASHGEAGPITPKTVEALICHLADVADSRLNGEVLNAAKYLSKEVAGEFLEIIDSETAFKIVNSKATGGWDLLQSIIEKIKQKE
ncbi:MAG: HDIG domain-containing protein [Candidatus Bathyarchaeia archaeon]